MSKGKSPLKRGKEKKQRVFSCASVMPELKHKFDGCAYDIAKSDVARWLVEQPQIRQYIFDMANNSGFIEYDKETGCWHGIDYDDGDEW